MTGGQRQRAVGASKRQGGHGSSGSDLVPSGSGVMPSVNMVFPGMTLDTHAEGGSSNVQRGKGEIAFGMFMPHFVALNGRALIRSE